MRPTNILSVPKSSLLISSLWWPSDRATRLRKMAKLLNLSKTASLRLEWFLWREARQTTIALTCRHFGITPKTYHKWAKRFEETNLRKLEDASTAPTRHRVKEYTPRQYERVVLLRRQYIRYGKEKILSRYRELYPEDALISLWKVQNIIQIAGIYYQPAKNARSQAKRKRAEKKKRITELKLKSRQGFLLCLDTVTKYVWGKPRYIFTAIDRYAKLAFARMYTSKNSRNASEFLARLKLLTANRIENVGHDNGSEFQGEFASACQKFGIQQYHSRVKTPKDNAVNERFNRTLQEEFIQLGNLTDDTAKFNQRLTEWLIEYNFKRPHASLGYMSPINFIYRYNHLLPMYPSDTYN